MTRRWVYAAAATLATAAALGWAFSPRPIEVEAASVSIGRFENAIEDDGKTRLRDLYVVSSPLAGLLGRIALREGDQVSAGQVVARLQPTLAPLLDLRTRREQQARLAAAQAQVDAAAAAAERTDLAQHAAERDARRSLALAREGFVAASRVEAEQLAALAAAKEHDSAMAQRQIALHEVAQARAALSISDAAPELGNVGFALRSPIKGQVLRVVQASEAAVAQGAPLLELGETRQLEVVAELLSTDALQARVGSPVQIDRWGGPMLQGRVRQVEPAAFTKISALGVEEQRVKVLIDLLERPETMRDLGVGYRVNVRILTTRIEQTRKVPVSAVFPLPAAAHDGEERMAVYTIEGGRARLRAVRLGGRNALEAWVLDGLATGDKVIVYPETRIRDGVRVAVREVVRAP
jgi:HlyD family secretion protein